MKLKIFVGSSLEGLPVARAIQEELGRDASVTIWDQGVFGLGQSALVSLIAALRNFDCAILIFRADDRVVSRDSAIPAARDNVLFELGLFMGQLGPQRTLVVYDRANPAKIISDLSGITFATYDGTDDLRSSVGSACNLIRQEIGAALAERWYSEYRLGKKLYRETLIYSLYSPEYPAIIGRKLYEEDGKPAKIYDLRGFRGEGFEWLEYHSPDGTGGGAIMLRTGTPSVRSGLIIAGHCDTGVLRCYANRWVRPDGDVKYKPEWLREVGQISPQDLHALRESAESG